MSLGIYIQIPFCQTKCTYCNFNTTVVSSDRYWPYAQSVFHEIALSAWQRPEVVDTVYIGGGTPSLFDPAYMARILEELRSVWRTESPEITLEVDPETVTPEKATAWLAAGFNRISLGSQSFNDRELQAAGRMHRSADNFRAVETLRAAGFRNISMDLIAGLAHQTPESWEKSVSRLLDIRPEHASVYMLEIDEDSHLGKESLAGGSHYSAEAVPDDDTIADLYEFARQRLHAAGYDHYEISNWGLLSHRSRHNLKYWRREPYLGYGAGAHSFDGTTRWSNAHDSARYLWCMSRGSSPREDIEPVIPWQAFNEEIFLGLRMLEGIDLHRIEQKLGTELPERLATVKERIAELHSLGFLEVDGPRVRLAPDHLTVSNEVFLRLLE